MPGRQHDVVDCDGPAVIEHDPLAIPRFRDDVRGRGPVPDDFNVWRELGEQGLVEPRQVLTHEPSRQVVTSGDRDAADADKALPVDPRVAALSRPLEQAQAVRRRDGVVGPRIKGQLTTGVIEHQVVRLLRVVRNTTEAARLDGVDSSSSATPACGVDRALQHTQTPRAQADNGNVDHETPRVPP